MYREYSRVVGKDPDWQQQKQPKTAELAQTFFKSKMQNDKLESEKLKKTPSMQLRELESRVEDAKIKLVAAQEENERVRDGVSNLEQRTTEKRDDFFNLVFSS
jgi:hypothetical protein